MLKAGALNIEECWNYRASLFWLTYREIRTRYRNAVLGLSWALLQPLASIVVIAGVFQSAIRQPGSTSDYSAFFACGIVPWLYFSKSLASASQGFMGYGEIVKRNYFPRVFVPLIFVLSHVADLAIGLLFLVVWFSGIGNAPSLAGLLAVLCGTLWLLTLCFAISLWLAPLQVWFRDIAYALSFALQGIFFVSPILYSTEGLAPNWRMLISLNPLTGILSVFRYGFLGAPPDANSLIASSVWTVLLLAGGLGLFFRLEKDLSDAL
jgi:lipopolysaccharide transport system permease protein